MLSSEFIFRIVGMIVFAFVGARIGIDLAPFLALPDQAVSLLFGLVGVLVGLIITPWITIRPVRLLRRVITERPVDVLLMSLLGLLSGLMIGLLAAYPLSLLTQPLGSVLPPAVTTVAAYLGLTIGTVRARELWAVIGEYARPRASAGITMHMGGGGRELLLDTSVLIDGRIVDIAQTGFLGGTLVVPRFVLSELHQVSDSSDPLRRNRGRRGLDKLNQLKADGDIPLRIVDEDFDEIPDVDSKLIMLARKSNALIVTNDYNLNRVAEAQQIGVLNVNALANAVRTIYIPGETFPIHVIQEGRDQDQGVGYLEDGTMVVIANGRAYMDRTINVTVTRLINKETGRMIFAEPA